MHAHRNGTSAAKKRKSPTADEHDQDSNAGHNDDENASDTGEAHTSFRIDVSLCCVYQSVGKRLIGCCASLPPGNKYTCVDICLRTYIYICMYVYTYIFMSNDTLLTNPM